MKKLQNSAAFLFIGSIGILSLIAVLGVWDVLGHDVIWKSFQTLGVCALVAAIALIAGRFMDSHTEQASSDEMATITRFRTIRSLTLTLLIAAVSLLALVGVLGIWDIITDTTVLYRALSSIAIVAFSSYIVVAVCLEREQHPLWQKRSSELSVGGFVGICILVWIAIFSRILG